MVMSIRIRGIKLNHTIETRNCQFNLLATRRFPSRKIAQNIQRFRQTGSSDGQCSTTGSLSTSDASSDRKEGSVQNILIRGLERFKLSLCVSLESPRSQTQEVHYAYAMRFYTETLLLSFYHSNIVSSGYFIKRFRCK